LAVVHAVYGLRILSNISLPSVAISNDSGQIDLRIHLKEQLEFTSRFSTNPTQIIYTRVNPNGNGEVEIQIASFEDGRYIGFFYQDGAKFYLERSGREIWADWPENYTLEDASTYLMGPVLAYALRLLGIVSLHASSIAVDGHAIAILGSPGAGKSTTAAAFASLGFPVLSDDVVVLQDQGNRFFVQPGYPRINMWSDSVRSLFGSEDALPLITSTWTKRYLPLDQNGYRFQAGPLPLGAVYLLNYIGPKVAITEVEDITGTEAMISLVAHTYINYLLRGEMRSFEFEVLKRLAAEVPIRRVRPTGDPTMVFELCETLALDAKRFF
jgi:hypothetical protein